MDRVKNSPYSRSSHRIPNISGKISVVSDLHMFSGVSDFNSKKKAARREELFKGFRASDYIVLNGDIFDIECAKDPQKAIHKSTDWLKTRMDEAPNAQFHFVLGNHESFIKFIKAMEMIEHDSAYEERFFFHEHYLQLGDNLWVHGDEQLGVGKYVKAYEKFEKNKKEGGKKEDIEVGRESSEGHRRRKLSTLSPLARRAYEQFNGIYHKAKNKQKGLKRIVDTIYHALGTKTFFEAFEESDLDGLTEAFKQSNHIFTGHTHEAYSAHYRDKYFHNTGTTVDSKFASFRPLEVTVENGRTNRIEPLLQKQKQKFAQRGSQSMPQGKKKKYFVTSDLHYFTDGVSRLGNHNKHTDLYTLNPDKDSQVKKAMLKAIGKSDVVVFNGDIFEFFFTEDSETAVTKARMQLQGLAKQYPKKEIHFVLGNHEAVKAFIKSAKEDAKDIENLFFHEHFYQPNNGKTVFVHGDEVVTGKYQERKIYSAKEAQQSKTRKTFNKNLEGLAMNYVRWWRNPKDTANNVVKAITEVPGISNPQSLENIFLGHTHVPFIDQPNGDKWVTNTGSATNHGRYAGVTLEMGKDGSTTTPRIIPVQADMGVVKVSGF